MALPVLLVFLMGVTAGIEVSAQYPQVPDKVNEIQGTMPAE